MYYILLKPCYAVVQKKFQEKHLATLAAIKGNVAGSTSSSTTSSTKTTGSSDMPVPPVRRVVGAIPAVQPQPRRPAGSGSGSDSVVQVDVKGKVRYKRNISIIYNTIICPLNAS